MSKYITGFHVLVHQIFDNSSRSWRKQQALHVRARIHNFHLSFAVYDLNENDEEEKKNGHKSRGIIRLFGACQSHMALWPTDGDAATAPATMLAKVNFRSHYFCRTGKKSPPNHM